MARMTEEEQEEEYSKSKPFSREGRMRASKVALGMIKGQPQSVRKKHQESHATTQEAGKAKVETAKATKAAEKAAERPPSKPPLKPPPTGKK